VTRPIEMGLGGWTNPDRDLKCGPTDPTLAVLEPMHVGGCKSCREVIVNMLKARHPAPPKAKPSEQAEFQFEAVHVAKPE
jgi:hypothetical protein